MNKNRNRYIAEKKWHFINFVKIVEILNIIGIFVFCTIIIQIHEHANNIKCIFQLCVYVCCLLITFAISLDPDQARQSVGPDLDPNRLTLWWYSWKNFSKKTILKKNQQTTKKHDKLPSMQS